MRLSRFFIDETLICGQQISLPAALVNYIVNVLRLKTGAKIVLFNAQKVGQQSGEFSASLTEINKRKCLALIESFTVKNLESPLVTHLFQGISRSERMDYTIQKAVELGVSHITPVITQRSNAKKLSAQQQQKKRAHWQGVASSACEQSGRTHLVSVSDPIAIEQIANYPAQLQLILSPDARNNLRDYARQTFTSINLLIGPEGGLAPQEIERAMSLQYQQVQLGKRILRTETAGLTALSILQFLWGDLG